MTPNLPSVMFLKRPNTKTRPPLISFRHHIDTPSPIVLDSLEPDGALVRGQLLLDVNNVAVEVKDLPTTFNVYITQKRPYKKGCKACRQYALESKSCCAITTSAVLKPATHSFPFSLNVGTYVPPSMDTSLIEVTWELDTAACVQPQGQSQTIPRLYTYKRDLYVVRSIRVPIRIAPSRHVFRATGIELSCQYDPVTNKTGANKVGLTLSGLLSHPDDAGTIHVWKILKGSWWVAESLETIAKAYGSHYGMSCEKERQVERDRKQTIVLGRGEIYDVSMPNTNANAVNLSFEYSLKKQKRSLSFTNETSDRGEAALSHSLVIENVLIKEHYPKDGSASPTRTGIARILRSSHNLFLSDYIRSITHNQDQDGDLPCYEETGLCPPNYQ